MERTGFWVTVSATVKLSGAELKQLIRSAQTHYDGYCKRTAEPGGFLYGFGNELLLERRDCDNVGPLDEWPQGALDLVHEFTISNHQLDCLCKITEIFNHNEGAVLHFPLKRALIDCNTEFHRLNNLPDPTAEPS